MVKKYRGAETDDFSRVQFSLVNYEYYKNLVKIVFDDEKQEKEFLDNVKDNKYNDLKTYFDGIVFGKWLTETEKLFYVNSLYYVIQKNNYLNKLLSLAYTKISNRKIKVYLSFGSAGKSGLKGYFSYSLSKSNELVIQFNHLKRTDKILSKSKRANLKETDKIKHRLINSGIGVIYHEIGHYLDFSVINYSLPPSKQTLSYPSREEYKEEIRRWTMLFFSKKQAKRKADYYSSESEVFARMFEIYNNYEIFDNKFAFSQDYMPALMYEILYVLPQRLGIYDYLKNNFFEKYK